MRAHAITRAYHRSPTIRMMVNLHQLMENLHQPNRNVLYRLGKADIGRNRKLKQITSQKTCREKEHFEILNIARGGIEAGNDLLIKFLAFLFRSRESVTSLSPGERIQELRRMLQSRKTTKAAIVECIEPLSSPEYDMAYGGVAEMAKLVPQLDEYELTYEEEFPWTHTRVRVFTLRE